MEIVSFSRFLISVVNHSATLNKTLQKYLFPESGLPWFIWLLFWRTQNETEIWFQFTLQHKILFWKKVVSGEWKLSSWREKWSSEAEIVTLQIKESKRRLKTWCVLFSADRSCSDVRRCVHGGHRLPPGLTADRQLPAVPSTQALAPGTPIYEPDQRGKWCFL